MAKQTPVIIVILKKNFLNPLIILDFFLRNAVMAWTKIVNPTARAKTSKSVLITSSAGE